jgi:RNA polymerase sigma factor (sigma-70 family)
LFKPLWLFLVNEKHVPELDAEELVQDVLMKVYFSVGKFRRDGRAELTTWMFQIAENRAVDFHRVRREVHQELTESDLPVRWSGQFAGRNTAWLEWLGGELAELPAESQRILFWRANDFSYAEIAGWLGVKVNTARTRHFRAKAKIELAANTAGMLGVGAEQDIREPEATDG